jgi:hypothetical protein
MMKLRKEGKKRKKLKKKKKKNLASSLFITRTSCFLDYYLVYISMLNFSSNKKTLNVKKYI